MSVKMSGIKMSEVFDLEPGSRIGFLPYWSDKKCVYASAAIRSYDSNQELIASQAETIAKQQEQLEQLELLTEAARGFIEVESEWWESDPEYKSAVIKLSEAVLGAEIAALAATRGEEG